MSDDVAISMLFTPFIDIDFLTRPYMFAVNKVSVSQISLTKDRLLPQAIYDEYFLTHVHIYTHVFVL